MATTSLSSTYRREDAGTPSSSSASASRDPCAVLCLRHSNSVRTRSVAHALASSPPRSTMAFASASPASTRSAGGNSTASFSMDTARYSLRYSRRAGSLSCLRTERRKSRVWVRMASCAQFTRCDQSGMTGHTNLGQARVKSSSTVASALSSPLAMRCMSSPWRSRSSLCTCGSIWNGNMDAAMANRASICSPLRCRALLCSEREGFFERLSRRRMLLSVRMAKAVWPLMSRATLL
mmetsp:Transcript_4188/g.13500  ORF Transcript_4188/g.13500 Transcript_4188/m.13500 type:complete len:236 (+) Transcript_4188:1549-2256(+)